MFRVPNRYLPDRAEDTVASGLRYGLSFTDAVKRLKVREEWRRAKLADAASLFDELAQIQDASELIHRLRTRGGLDRHYADAEQLNPTDQSAIDTLAHAEDASAGMTSAEYAATSTTRRTSSSSTSTTRASSSRPSTVRRVASGHSLIVAGVQEGELPHARSVSADDPEGEMEGERRLAYVAFTRARDRLVLLHTAGAPSRFIAEAAIAVGAIRRRVGRNLAPDRQHRASELVACRRLDDEAYSRLGWKASSAPRRAPQPPTSPVRAPYVRQVPAPRVAMDVVPGTSIPCSLPGCYGTVGPTSSRSHGRVCRTLCAIRAS